MKFLLSAPEKKHYGKYGTDKDLKTQIDCNNVIWNLEFSSTLTQ